MTSMASMTSATNGNARFDTEAAAWDSNPDVHRASESALQAILERFPELRKAKDAGTQSSDGFDVLELGCGTGLLSLRMAPYVRSLTAIDASTGMIKALEIKLQDPSNAAAAAVVQPLCIMLEDPNDQNLPAAQDSSRTRRKYDLVISHLVLHHIADLPGIIKTLHGVLKPGSGWLAMTDYEDYGPEARRFHPESKMAGVERHGIKKTDMEGWLKDEGLQDVKVEVGWTMQKDVEEYPGHGVRRSLKARN